MTLIPNEFAPKPPVEPFLAATIILVDRTQGSEAKILLGRRHASLSFMPGKFVFPGGRSELADAKVTAKGALSPHASLRLRQPSLGDPVAQPDALALTAIREMFEETGLLLGDRTHAPPSTAPADTSWAKFLKLGVVPNLSQIHYVARALTPAESPRRFNTHFFASESDSVAASIEGHVHAEAELVELRWVTVAELAEIDTVPITRLVAAEFAQRLAAGFGHDLPVPFLYFQDKTWIRTEL